MKSKLQKFYAITDRNKYIPFEETVKMLLDKGIRMFQIREKDLPSGQLYKFTENFLKITSGYDIHIFINDRIDIALMFNLDGVHLPENSFSVEVVKANFPNLLVGKSCHSIESALNAEKEGADYIIFSPIFKVEGKGNPQGLDKLKEVVKSVKIPVYALGGINKTNIEEVLNTGVYGVAGIRTFLS
jgi:thiamine-phosphate pyrophosphorylase